MFLALLLQWLQHANQHGPSVCPVLKKKKEYIHFRCLGTYSKNVNVDSVSQW